MIPLRIKKSLNSKGQVQSKSDYLIEYLSSSWRPYTLILIAGILVFGRTIWFGYTYFDDDLLIIKKIDSISHLSAVFKSFGTLYFGPYYRPVITISLITDALISNVNPWMYHVSNLIYHLAAGCLTFYMLSKLTASKTAALFAGIVFILHPLATQSVAWIPGRNDSLLTIFILLSFIFFIKSESRGKYYFFFLHLLFFYIALFTKETALIFPLIVLSYYYTIERAPLFSAKIIKYIIGWLPGILLWYLLRSSALSSVQLNADTFSPAGLFSNIYAMLETIGKLLFPVRLSVYPTIHPVSTALGIIAVTALIAFLIIWRKNINRIVIFSIMWIVLFSLPSLIVNIADSGNRFSYLECRGYILIAGFAILLAGIYQMNNIRPVKRTFAFIIPLILLYSILAITYSTSYQNPLSHWEKAVQMSPQTSDTYYNLGIVSFQLYNNPDMGEDNFKKAIALNSSNNLYHNWLGVVYGEKKMSSLAESEFFTAIKLNPADPSAYSNLGFLNYVNKNFAESEKYYKQAISADPDFTEAYYKLILLCTQQRRYAEALQYADLLKAKGVELEPALLKHLNSKK
jgi:protein O-mannosyl-transferase